MQVKKPNPIKFEESVARRQNTKLSLEQVVAQLAQHYQMLDLPARRAFIDNTVQMYANYENRWLGESNNGNWVEATPQGTNNVYFTVPLLTAHVDTHTTFYTKTRPQYLAKPFVNNHLGRRLAEMCQEIGTNELARMLSYSKLQHEAQNIALATVSYRQIVMDLQPHSPSIVEEREEMEDHEVAEGQCLDCGSPVEVEDDQPPQCQNESCMSQNVVTAEPQTVQKPVVKEVRVPLPRPAIRIPNPIAIQDDFNAATFGDTRFIISRRKISRKEAEFYYQIDLSSTYDTTEMESETQHRLAREPIGPQEHKSDWLPLAFPQYVDRQNEMVDEVMMWLDPCEYGLFFADGQLLKDKFPTGAFFHVVGDVLVEARPSNKKLEWIRVQHGVRPGSNRGVGLTHLADLNDAINNAISLEYSILRTHGFPIRLLRGRWMSEVPQANETIVMDKIPEDRALSEAMHTEQASNTSGLLGVITQRFQGFMQYIGGSINPVGMPQDAKDYMGSATAAASFQEMMSNRMGLAIQMRVEADIETIYAVLTLLQQDPRNRQYFLDSGYDQAVVDEFFSTDFRSAFYFEPVKGTDAPRLESVNTFKVQSFANLTASLTGLRQYDQDTFYDIVAALGETLNIDVAVGAGRSERNLADNRIARIVELYKNEKDVPEKMGMDPVEFGMSLFQAVTMKDSAVIQETIKSQMPPPPKPQPGMKPEQMMMMVQQYQQQAQHIAETIELGLYDYDALRETYSDWMQSDAGQNADIPVAIAVAQLYASAVEMIERKKTLAQQEQMQMMQMQAMMSMKPDPKQAAKDEDDKKADNPPGPAKRDGSSGPGRPRDVKVDSPE